MDDPQEHLTPEHLSLLAAILSQPGTRAEDAVKQALGLFHMACLHLAIRSARRDPTLQRLEILMEDVFPPEKVISIKAAYDAAGNKQYKTIEGFQRALSRSGLLLNVRDADTGQERIETSMVAVQLLREWTAQRSRIVDRERKSKKRARTISSKSSADKIDVKPDKKREIRKSKDQKRTRPIKNRSTR
jgi:hypothetical protein